MQAVKSSLKKGAKKAFNTAFVEKSLLLGPPRNKKKKKKSRAKAEEWLVSLKKIPVLPQLPV